MNNFYYHVFSSPVGPLLAWVDEKGTVLGVRFLPEDGEGRALAELSRAGRTVRDLPRTGEVRRQIAEYFAGERRVFDLPLALAGTDFQNSVWRELQRIPFGETRGYGEIAKAIGRPGAARAVGRAAGANPIPIIIPCHRCLGADGSLIGFAGGLEIKRRLLALEGIMPPVLPAGPRRRGPKGSIPI